MNETLIENKFVSKIGNLLQKDTRIRNNLNFHLFLSNFKIVTTLPQMSNFMAVLSSTRGQIFLIRFLSYYYVTEKQK